MDLIALEKVGPVGIVIAGIVFLYRAFIKGDIVPGSLYRDQVTRADKAEVRADKMEIQADRNTDAIESMANAVKSANERRSDAAP